VASCRPCDPCGKRLRESCHGKCLCDPEGGTIKNAAKAEELRSTHHVMKDSYAFYEWAATRSGLDKPSRDLEDKEGKGIFRRFFYWIPAKGVGAVDRSRLPTYKAEGTSKLHEFVDIGVVGTVSTRRAACQMCARCWECDRSIAKTCATPARLVSSRLSGRGSQRQASSA